MTVLKRAGLALAWLLLAGSPALAQPTRNPGGIPAYDSVTDTLRQSCVDGAGATVSCAGGAGATAAANGTVAVTAGTGKPPAIDLFSSTSVLVKDTLGVAIDWAAPVPVNGAEAIDAPLTRAPVVIACRASGVSPTTVADGDVQALRCSGRGNLITGAWGTREQIADQSSTITSSVAAATCVTAGGAGVLHDLVGITLANTSATATEFQILDADGTTVRWTGFLPASDMRGQSLPLILKQLTANTAWTCKTVTSVASVKITLQFVKN